MYQQHLYLSICLVTSTSLLNQPRFVFRHRHHHHYHCHHYIQAIWGRWSVIAFYCDMPAVKVAARAVVKRLNGDFVKSFNKYDHSLWRWEISARGEPQQIWLEEFGQRLSQPGISATWISLNLSSRIHRGSFESCIEEHLLELGTKQMLSILNVERSAIAQASTFTHYQCYQCYNVTILQCYNVTNATNATQHRPPNWDQPDITPILPFSPLPFQTFDFLLHQTFESTGARFSQPLCPRRQLNFRPTTKTRRIQQVAEGTHAPNGFHFPQKLDEQSIRFFIHPITLSRSHDEIFRCHTNLRKLFVC